MELATLPSSHPLLSPLRKVPASSQTATGVPEGQGHTFQQLDEMKDLARAEPNGTPGHRRTLMKALKPAQAPHQALQPLPWDVRRRNKRFP